MIRDHVGHLHTVIDDQSIVVRLAVVVGALLALPLLGSGVRALGSVLGLGWATVPLLVVAHVPAVIALIGLWSIGTDLYDAG